MDVSPVSVAIVVRYRLVANWLNANCQVLGLDGNWIAAPLKAVGYQPLATSHQLTHQHSRIPYHHLTITRHIPRRRILHKFSLGRSQILRRSQHRRRRSVTAHADVFTDHDFIQPARIQRENPIDRLLIFHTRESVALVMIHITRSQHEHWLAPIPKNLPNGPPQTLKHLILSGPDRNRHEADVRALRLPERQLDFDRWLLTMRLCVIDQLGKTVEQRHGQFRVDRGHSQRRFPCPKAHDRQRMPQSRVIRAHDDAYLWHLQMRVNRTRHMPRIHVACVRYHASQRAHRVHMRTQVRLHVLKQRFRISRIKLSGYGRMANSDRAHENLLSEAGLFAGL